MQAQQTENIPFTQDPSGIIYIDVSINGISEKFIFDTGASGITLNPSLYNKCKANGSISSTDIIQKVIVKLADGSQKSATMVNLKNVSIGSYNLKNINAVVMPDQNAPLLVGQSVFQEFGKISIDYKKDLIILEIDGNQITTNDKTSIENLKIIACNYPSLGKVSLSKNILSKGFAKLNLTEEKSFPPPLNAIDNVSKGYTLRYFSNADFANANEIRSKLEQELGAPVILENMLPYFNYKELPGYLELWIK
jgi:clan AA aspartic protease (TIGR02281 family)